MYTYVDDETIYAMRLNNNHNILSSSSSSYHSYIYYFDSSTIVIQNQTTKHHNPVSKSQIRSFVKFSLYNHGAIEMMLNF